MRGTSTDVKKAREGGVEEVDLIRAEREVKQEISTIQGRGRVHAVKAAPG